MEEDKKDIINENKVVENKEENATPVDVSADKPKFGRKVVGATRNNGEKRFSKKEKFHRQKRGKSQRSEFDRRVISVRRVTRVVAGGRRFSLSVAVAVGDKKGKVGIGLGKGPDMAIAMEKATNQAKKNMMKIPLTEDKSIPNEVVSKYSASVVSLRPSKSGFVAGGAVRTIAELAGIRNLNTKILSRSKNHINNAKATIKAFEELSK